MNRLLGYCIPTYNRRDSLKVILKSLLSQIKSYEIPIYISDNASEDGTEDMVKDLQREYPFIFYKKQEFNKGIDINMLDVIQMADTKYAWLLGDDDIVIKKGLEYIYNLLKRDGDLSLILFNGYEVDLSKSIYKYVWDADIIGDFYYSDCRFLFKRIFYKLPHFANLIINIDKIKDININPERFIGTYHAYIGLTLDFLGEEFLKYGENKILTISKPMIYLGSMGVKKTWINDQSKIILLGIPELFRKIHIIYKPYVREYLVYIGEHTLEQFQVSLYFLSGKSIETLTFLILLIYLNIFPLIKKSF